MLKMKAIVGLLLLLLLTVGMYTQDSFQRQYTDLTKVVIKSENGQKHVVIAWVDATPILRTDKIKAVKVTYGIANQAETNQEKLVYRFEGGVSLSGMDLNYIHYVLVTYMDDKYTPQLKRHCFPFYVVLQTMSDGCKYGVYDLILNLLPEYDTWDLNAYTDIPHENSFTKSNFTTEMMDSDLGYYKGFCMGMLDQESSSEKWLYMDLSHPGSHLHIIPEGTTKQFVEESWKNHVADILGDDKPAGYTFNGGFGFNYNGTILGFYDDKNDVLLRYGLGIPEYPYVGLYLSAGGNVIRKPMSGVLLGSVENRMLLIGPSSQTCPQKCDSGGQALDTNGCIITHAQWYLKFDLCTTDPPTAVPNTLKSCNRRPCGKPLKPVEITNIEGLSLTEFKVYWEDIGADLKENGIDRYELKVKLDTATIFQNLTIQDGIYELTVTGLTYDKLYNVSLTACTSTSCSEAFKTVSKWRQFIILYEVFAKPSVIPLDVVGYNISSDAIYMTWDPSNAYYTWVNSLLVKEINEEDDSRSEVDGYGPDFMLPNGTSEYNITGLKVFTLYQVSLAYKNNIDVGVYDVQEIRTDEKLPSQEPLQFRVQKFSTIASSLKIKWKAITDEHKNGIILGYNLTYTSEREGKMFKIIAEAPLDYYTLENVQENTHYTFTLSGFNTKGHSPEAGREITTDMSVPDYPTGVKAYNTSDTSINVTWYMDYFMWNANMGGFLLKLVDLEDFSSVEYNLTYHNLTNNENITSMTEINSTVYIFSMYLLFPYHNYTVQLSAYNEKGAGLFCPQRLVTTEQQAPFDCPKNLAKTDITGSKITLNWRSVRDCIVHGIIHSFTVYCKMMVDPEILVVRPLLISSSRKRRDVLLDDDAFGDHTTSIRERRNVELDDGRVLVNDGLQLQWENFTLLGNATGFVIDNLIGNVFYNISVALNTKFPGIPTPPMLVKTKENTPLFSCYQFRCETSAPTRIILYWVHAPLPYARGERVAYDIRYRYKLRGIDEETIDNDLRGTQTIASIGNLEPWTDYEFYISLKTNAGKDNYTEQDVMVPQLSKFVCKTSPTIPSEAPGRIAATSYESPYTTTIRWSHIDNYNWKGTHDGYTINAKRKSIGGVATFGQDLVIKNLTRDDFTNYTINVNVTLNGSTTLVNVTMSKYTMTLEANSEYRIKVAARTQVGTGVWSENVYIKTCHVPYEDITVYYKVFPPYITHNPFSDRPEGALVDIFEKSIYHCCHYCNSFSTNISIKYNQTGNPVLRSKDSVFYIPHMSNGKVDPNFDDLVLATSPGFTLVERPLTEEEEIIRNESLFFDGVVQLFPLIFLYFCVNGLFGCIFWFVEPFNVGYKGNGRSLAGLFEGLYLAVMTSTTVGYGDKIPFSTPGRLYIIMWTILGLVCTGIVIGQLSSSLTLATKGAAKYPDEKVIAKFATNEYVYGEKHFKGLVKDVKYYDSKSLLDELMSDSDVRYALFESNEVEFELKANVSDNHLNVRYSYDVKFTVGAIAFEEMKKLTYCASGFAISNPLLFENALDELRIKDTNPTAHEEDLPLVQWSAPIFQIILFYLSLSLLVCMVFGSVYELIRKRILCKKIRARIQPEDKAKKNKELQDLKDYSNDFIEEFQKLKERISRDGDEMIYEHGEEVLFLFDCLKKLSGVDLKYANESDLVLPLRTILDMKEKRQKKHRKNAVVLEKKSFIVN